MGSELDTYEQLRSSLIGNLHLGRLKAGDRLPSIREVARDTGVDHRAVARAYQMLADEGLVEVRGRSGVVVAAQEVVGGVLEETARWLSELAVEGWLRRKPLVELTELVQRALRPGVRCLFVESTEDHEVAVCRELREDFGLEVEAIRLVGSPMTTRDRRRVTEVLGRVDFAVTTAFHAASLQPVAAELDRKIVSVVVNPLLREQVVRMLQRRNARVVIADPAYVERARQYMHGFVEGDHYHLVLADSDEAQVALAHPMSAMFTRAARERMGVDGYHLLPGPDPFISAESAREIASLIIQANLQ